MIKWINIFGYNNIDGTIRNMWWKRLKVTLYYNLKNNFYKMMYCGMCHRRNSLEYIKALQIDVSNSKK